MARYKNENRDILDVIKLFNKGVVTYGLIQDGDKILVGLSGGKDSMALLELLAKRSKIYKPKFEVIAAHIAVRNINYKSDIKYLEDFCKSLDVPFIYAETEFDPSTDTRKSPCFLCSWNRRKMLFTVAQENGCNKIALGHHMDDIIETLYMNMMFQGAFSTMPPALKMRKFDITIIRPMCLVPEKLLIEMAELRQYRKQIKNCPYEHDSHRSDVKQLLKRIEEINPEARYNIWGSMTNIQKELLPFVENNNKTI